MKVLHLNTTDRSGGAAIAAQRLHTGLKAAGIESIMLVQHKTIDSYSILGPESPIEKAFAALRYPITRRWLNFTQGIDTGNFSPDWLEYNIVKRIETFDPDIIHLHYICRGFLKPEQFKKMGRPLVWTLHDMWPYTGGCHLDEGCGRYKDSCGRCPILNSSREKDLSRRLWLKKKRAYENLDLTVVTLSQWMQRCVKASTLLSGFPLELIPNGLDLNIFKIIERDVARKICDLPQNKSLILFGTISAVSKENKGLQFLQPVLKNLSNQLENIELMVFGSSEPTIPQNFGFPARYMGRLHDEVSLALIYSAADVFVAPSKQDNLPNTVMEALACGTPCVAFEVGGMPDLIDHKKNGYLAAPFDTADMAAGLNWVLTDTSRREMLSKNARDKAVHCYSQELQTKRMVALYEKILG